MKFWNRRAKSEKPKDIPAVIEGKLFGVDVWVLPSGRVIERKPIVSTYNSSIVFVGVCTRSLSIQFLDGSSKTITYGDIDAFNAYLLANVKRRKLCA